MKRTIALLSLVLAFAAVAFSQTAPAKADCCKTCCPDGCGNCCGQGCANCCPSK